MGPNVSVPLELLVHASVGLNYLFASPPRASMVVRAWREFERRVRWSAVFVKESKTPYDPDYDSGRRSQKEPPLAPRAIEDGLLAGRQLLRSRVRHAHTARIVSRNVLLSSLVDVTPLLEVLKDNAYLIVPTDKNLGVAVVAAEWYVAECRKLLTKRRQNPKH